MRLVDTHAHIDELENIDSVLERAKKVGVSAIIAVGSNFNSDMRVLELSQKYRGLIYPAIGIHPLESETAPDSVIELIENKIDECVAVGEVGLDYRSEIDKSLQKKIFQKMLMFARKHSKPVSLHSRGAWEDVLSYMLDYGIVKGIFHWYSGPLEILKKILDSGYYVSATPAVEYSPKHREAIMETPIDALLLETDTPVKYRGIQSEPSHVSKVLTFVAKIKNIPASKLAEVTTENSRSLFGIDDGCGC
ncbi:TatD family hydrolase [Candidatus Bathyarchaeota archaeon]|nr:TatD family hydrolase [Candidatus Bathyarchaeota archaeon]MBS7629042.1 TatD family hydrolase [Candidatus Bathyarchaeota archaeon]